VYDLLIIPRVSRRRDFAAAPVHTGRGLHRARRGVLRYMPVMQPERMLEIRRPVD
jgi:hypothetical protein